MQSIIKEKRFAMRTNINQQRQNAAAANGGVILPPPGPVVMQNRRRGNVPAAPMVSPPLILQPGSGGE